jgi:hypothetical protein
VAPERQGRAMLRRGALCGKRVFSLTPKIRAAAQRRPTVIQISEYRKQREPRNTRSMRTRKARGGKGLFFSRLSRVSRFKEFLRRGFGGLLAACLRERVRIVSGRAIGSQKTACTMRGGRRGSHCAAGSGILAAAEGDMGGDSIACREGRASTFRYCRCGRGMASRAGWFSLGLGRIRSPV